MDTCARLAATGFDQWGAAFIALLVLGIGVTAVLVARLRRVAGVGTLLVGGLLALAIVTGGATPSATAADDCTVPDPAVAANTAPVAVADSASVLEDALPPTVTGSLLANDSDADGDPLTLTTVGTSVLLHGSLDVASDGTFVYTLDNSDPAVDALNDGQQLTDTFTYVVSDGHGGTASAILTVTVEGATDNHAPLALADSNTVREDAIPTSVTGNVLANDTDPDGDTMVVTNAGTVILSHGVLVMNADGSYSYTLDNSDPAVDALNDGQQLTDTFTYVVSDGHGGTETAILAIRIDGSTDNRAPAIVADVDVITEDALPNTVAGNVLANDSDPDGNILSVVNAGTVTLQYGSLEIHADGSYTYTLDNSNPAVDALNSGQHLIDTFTYVASDGHGGTSSTTLAVRIDGTSD